MILNPSCRYSLLIYLDPSSMLFTFRFLSILHVENIMRWNMVSMKKMPLMCMRSHHRMTLLYLSRMTLADFGTKIYSTCWILWRTVLTCKYVIKVPYISSYIPTYSRRIGIFCRMMLSTRCMILFTDWPLMLWNCLAQSALFISQAVYCLFSPHLWDGGA